MNKDMKCILILREERYMKNYLTRNFDVKMIVGYL